jgi:hypothetical protein
LFLEGVDDRLQAPIIIDRQTQSITFEKIFIVYSLVFGQTSLLFRIDGQNYKNILSYR